MPSPDPTATAPRHLSGITRERREFKHTDGRPYFREIWVDDTGHEVANHPDREPHLARALDMLGLPAELGTFAAGLPRWLTVDAVFSLRQSLRESSVNDWAEQPEDFCRPGHRMTREEFRSWISVARHYDAIHHGHATF